MAATRSKDSDLSRTELGVLKRFWRSGRLSAREVHDSLGVEMGWAYTTTRTTLDRMVKKGLLTREPFHGLYLYAAAVGKVSTVARLVREFTERVLELDSVPVATLFADSEMLDADELAELEALLAEATPTDAEPDGEPGAEPDDEASS